MTGTNRKLRILHTSPFVPYPPDSGGKLVNYHYITGLARRGHEVTFLAPLRRPGDEDALGEMSGPRRIVPVRCGSVSRMRLAARTALAGESIRIARHRLRAVELEFRKILAGERFDVIILDSLFTTYLIRVIRDLTPSTPIVLVNHNVESKLFERYLANRSPIVRAAGRIESARIRTAESQAVLQADRVIVLSKVDARYIGELAPGAATVVLPPGTPVSPGEEIPVPEDSRTLLFLGSFRWEPNREAVRRLAATIYPAIRSRIPGAKLLIAGEDPDGRMRSLHDPIAGIHVLGRVEDSRLTIREAAIFLVPLRIGSGVRLKILEAFANERPVVSTSLGCEGIPVEHGYHLIIADDDDSFIESVLGLIGDPERTGRIAAAGRALAEREYGWDRIVERLEGILTDLIS